MSFFVRLILALNLIACTATGVSFIPYLIFPRNGQMGYITAIAIPLDLTRFNVFMSYNYEANWNLHTLATELRGQPLLFPPTGENFVNDGPHQRSMTDTPNDSPFWQKLMSRNLFYRTIVDKMNDLHGLPGKECLLRAICEHASVPLAKYNGFVGDIMHIMLSPHSSKYEPELDDEYYEAERMGKRSGNNNCDLYNRKCGISVLDLISSTYNP